MYILDVKFVGCTSRGHTGGRSHGISHPPSFCDACLNFSREKDSAVPFPRRPCNRILCTNDFIVLHLLSFFFLSFFFCSEEKSQSPGFELISQRVRRLRGYQLSYGATGSTCVCVFSSHPFWTSSSLDVPAGVTQEEGHTGFLIHLPSACPAIYAIANPVVL